MKELEGPLLRLESSLMQTLQGLLASGMLLAGDDATVVLHQIALLQATRGMLGSSVKYFRFGASCFDVSRHCVLLNASF